MDDLAHAADLFVLGELNGADLSMAAAEALARGLESPALVELACLHRTDCGGAPELFRTAMAELDVVTDWRAREVDVRIRLARDHATALLADEGASASHLGEITVQLMELAGYPDPPAPELEDLAREFEVLSEYLEFVDPATIRDADSTGVPQPPGGPALRAGERAHSHCASRAAAGTTCEMAPIGRLSAVEARDQRRIISTTAFGAASHSRTLLRTSVICLHSQ